MGKISGYDHVFDDGKSFVDEHGNRIDAYKNAFDDGVTYYKDGKKVGSSYQNAFDDGVTTYDAQGRKVSSTYKNVYDDGYSTFDSSGRKVSSTYDNPFDDGTTTYTYGSTGSVSGLGAGYTGFADDFSSSISQYAYGASVMYKPPKPSVDGFTGRCRNRDLKARDEFDRGVEKAWSVLLLLNILAAVYLLVSLMIRVLPYPPQINYWVTILLTAVLSFLPGFKGEVLPEYYIGGFGAAVVHTLLAPIRMIRGLGYWNTVKAVAVPYLRTASIFTVAGILIGYIPTLILNRRAWADSKLNDDEKNGNHAALAFMLLQLPMLWALSDFRFDLRIYLFVIAVLVVVHGFFYSVLEGARPLTFAVSAGMFVILLVFGYFASRLGLRLSSALYYLTDACGPVYLIVSACAIFASLVAGGTRKSGFKTIIGVLWFLSCAAASLPMLWYRLPFLNGPPSYCITVCFALLFVLHLSVSIFYKQYEFGRTLRAFAIGMVCILLDYFRFWRYLGLRGYFLGKPFLVRAGVLTALLLVSAIPAMARKKGE